MQEAAYEQEWLAAEVVEDLAHDGPTGEHHKGFERRNPGDR